MSVDDSGSIDDRRLAEILAFESTLIDHNLIDDTLVESIPEVEVPDVSTVALRDCLRLLEETLPRGSEQPIGGQTPGERIGRFTILGELGRGGFGVVLRAFDPALQRQVALKVPRPEFLTNAEARRRFLREGWAVSRLEHPNIVPVLEAGEAGPVGYIASALCEGPSLATWLVARGAPLPPRAAARLVAALADAVAHAHAREVLHRDLKPANIILQGGGIDPKIGPPQRAITDALPFVPRICDFGLAKLLDQTVDETRTAAVIGSPPYMAPEQAEGRGVDIGTAADIYGLGAILYELLTGQPPFRGETSLETLRLVVQDDPAPPRSLRSGLPADLETIALKCLEKRPEHRYATASALADDLNRFLDGRPIMARPLGVIRRSIKWARRRPAQAMLAAFLVLAGLISVGGLLGIQWWQARQNAILRTAVSRAEMSEKNARHRFFTSLVTQARIALDGGHERQAMNLLESARRQFLPDESPGFAWSILRQRIHSETVLERRGPAIRALEISPDGRILAALDAEENLVLWDLSLKRLRRILPGKYEKVRFLAFSPDSRRLAVSHIGDPPRVTIWDVEAENESPPKVLTRFYPSGLSFSRDGLFLTALHDTPGELKHHLVYVDLSVGKCGPVNAKCDQGELARLGFSPVDPILQKIADALDDKPVAPLSEMPANLRGAAITEDRKYVVLASGGPTIELIDYSSHRVAIGVPGGPQGTMFVRPDPRPKGLHPMPNWEARINRLRRLFPPELRETRLRMVVQNQGPYRFDPSGRFLATERSDELLDVVDLRTGKATSLEQQVRSTALAFSPDSQTLIAAGIDGNIRIRQFQTSERNLSFSAHEKEVWGVSWSPDGRSLATSSDDGTLKIWAWDGEHPPQERATLSGHRALATSVDWSPDGKRLASSGFNPRVVRLWDATSKECLKILSGHDAFVRMVKFSPDGRSLASCSDDKTVRIWDLGRSGHSLRSPLRGHGDRVFDVAWSPDGRMLASASLDGRVILWDPFEGREIRSWKLAPEVFTVAWSPDGQTLAAGDIRGMIHLWNVSSATQAEVLSFMASTQTIRTLSFSPDGRSLASAGGDQAVRIWDPATSQELVALPGHKAQINRLAFSPDGRTLASCDHTGIVKLWRGVTD